MIMRATLVIWTLLFVTFVANANPYDYPILRVIDGDTIEFQADFLPGALKQKLSLRIYGVDTPEKSPRAGCSLENLKSLNAKLFTEQEIMNASEVKLYLKDWDKYGGRVIGDVILDGENLSTKLIKSGYAVPYFGGAKTHDWCKE